MYAELSRSFGSVPLNYTHAEDYDTPLISLLLDSFYLVFTLDCIILKFSENVISLTAKLS